MPFPKTDKFHLSRADKTIWIFGAGASFSKPYAVPQQKDLLDTFQKIKPQKSAVAKKEFEELRNRVSEECKKILPGSQLRDVTLEEVFSAFEIQEEAGWTTSEEKELARKAVSDLRKMLVITTGVRGRGDAIKYKPHKRGDRPSPYAEILEKLFPLKCKADLLKAHVLATMNYDISLDRCLLNMRNDECGNIDLDYGIEFADYRLPGSFERPSERSVLLLRLHGGLNWKRCSACQALFTTVSSHANVLPREKCRMCGSERLDHVIVPPSFTRQYTDPVLQIIWGRLLEELRSADRWVFIGYSLPNADVHLRTLLSHAFNMRSAAGEKISIYWVGFKRSADDKNWLDLGERFYHLFGDKAIAWEKAEEGFSGFVREMK